MLGVSSSEAGFDGGVVDVPEAGEVVGDLDGAVVGGEDVEEDGDGPFPMVTGPWRS